MSVVNIYQGYENKINEDIAVVIDVLRAFSTTYYLFTKGISKITMSQDPNLLKDLSSEAKGLLVGEKDGIKIDGFDFGNSPDEILPQDLADKDIFFCTTNGVRGVFHCRQSSEVYVTGLIGIEALIKKLELVIKEGKSIALHASHPSSDDDLAIAEYIKDKLERKSTLEIEEIKSRVKNSLSAAKFIDESQSYFKSSDLEYCIDLPESLKSESGFVMKAQFKDNNISILEMMK